MLNDNFDILKYIQQVQQFGPMVARQNAFNSMSQNPMTGYAGMVPQGAQDAQKVDWNYKLQNAPARMQAIGQNNSNADHDRALAEQYANSAYKDQDQGAMPMQGIAAMVNNLGQQQPFRNEPLQGFRNIFLALRGG